MPMGDIRDHHVHPDTYPYYQDCALYRGGCLGSNHHDVHHLYGHLHGHLDRGHRYVYQ
jgi:hypothetical protein